VLVTAAGFAARHTVGSAFRALPTCVSRTIRARVGTLPEEPEPETDDLTALAELLSLTDGRPRGPCVWFRGVLPAAEEESLGKAAWLIAEATMRHRCVGAIHVFDLWKAAASGEGDLSEQESKSVEPFVRTAFGLPDRPLPDDHVQGFVAEMTWFLVTSEVVRSDRSLVYIKARIST
jgi:hypothetical protein